MQYRVRWRDCCVLKLKGLDRSQSRPDSSNCANIQPQEMRNFKQNNSLSHDSLQSSTPQMQNNLVYSKLIVIISINWSNYSLTDNNFQAFAFSHLNPIFPSMFYFIAILAGRICEHTEVNQWHLYQEINICWKQGCNWNRSMLSASRLLKRVFCCCFLYFI
jgi:hypothetical protein